MNLRCKDMSEKPAHESSRVLGYSIEQRESSRSCKKRHAGPVVKVRKNIALIGNSKGAELQLLG
jgi:hypothetical protein